MFVSHTRENISDVYNREQSSFLLHACKHYDNTVLPRLHALFQNFECRDGFLERYLHMILLSRRCLFIR